MCCISIISVFGQTTLTHSYTFEDGTADDVIGTADGTLNGSTYSISGGMYTSVADGDYISFSGTDLALNTYTSGITIEAYVRAGNGTNPGWTMLAYFGGNSGDNAYFLSIARNDDVSRTQYVGGAYVDGAELEDGGLHHLVSILTDTNIVYYLDGAFVGKASHTKPVSDIKTDNALLCKGGWPDPSWLGSIYEFNIYSGVMDETTISSNASAFLNSSDARLSDLTVDAGTLTPVFDPLTSHYAIEIPTGTTTVNISATPMVPAATVIGGGAVDVSGGAKTDTIKVTSVDATTTKVYTVDIRFEDATCFVPLYSDKTNIITDPELTDLSNFAGWGSKNLVYGFDAYCGITAAKVAGNCGGSLDFDLDATGAILPNTSYRMKAMVYVGGSGKFKIGFFGTGMPSEIVASTQLDTWESLEMIFTTGSTLGTDLGLYFNSCEGYNGEIGYIDNLELYQVSDDATLSALSVSTGTLVPGFSSNVASYAVVVPSTTTSVNITATVNDPKASVTGDGTIALTGGEGTAEVVVTAESGSTKTYTITFSSSMSSDATLAGIDINVNYTISPAFDPETEEYNVVVATDIDTVIVTASTNHAAAEAEYNDTVDVRSGSETVGIVVTAEDGTQKTYTLNITYESTDCFVPYYSDGRTNYVPDPYLNSLAETGGWGAKSIVIGDDAYCGLSAAKLEDVDGSGCTAALDISNFEWKANTSYRVRVMVKTLGGTIGILASGTDPDFGFAFDTEGEWVELDTVFMTGASPGVGFFSFNTCDFSSNCTAAYIDNYELYELSPDASLSDLLVSGSTVNGFDAATYNYNVDLAAGTTDVPVVTATTTSEYAEAVVTAAAGLPGSTTVKVTAEDGVTEATYTINFAVIPGSDLTDVHLGPISIYPTISDGNFTVITSSKSSTIRVYDLKGTLILQQSGESFEQTLSLPFDGMYIVKVECDNTSKIFKLFSTKE